MMKTSFKIDIAKEELEDLQRRLSKTRWPDEITGSEWKWEQPGLYERTLRLLAGKFRLA